MLLVMFKKIIGKPDHRQADNEKLESLVLQAQAGDHKLRNEIIKDYQPYIIKVTSRFCKRYIHPEQDDEYSIAMNGFDEAINQYSQETGASFLSFAQTVMRRRLIDFIRKEKKHLQSMPLSSFEIDDGEDNVINPVENVQAMQAYEKEQEAEARKAEIMELNQALDGFGISFAELASKSPKHQDSRDLLLGIGRLLVNDEELMDILFEKKYLPIKQLEQKVTVSRKTLERNRKYIIAIAIIHSGQYPYLQTYLDILKAERSEGDE